VLFDVARLAKLHLEASRRFEMSHQAATVIDDCGNDASSKLPDGSGACQDNAVFAGGNSSTAG
jgi:hypothetical protein